MEEVSAENHTGIVQRHRTALHRAQISRPVRLALESEIITPALSVFDYGCGRGEDLRRLRELGVLCSGWDPAFQADAPLESADVVNLGYVVNVIEDAGERAQALTKAWSLARKALLVSARLRTELSDARYERCADGFLTQRSTFQKFYDQQELREWIDSILSVSSIPVAPGVFVVFRGTELAQSFLSNSVRRSFALPRISRANRDFESYRPLLAPLMNFIAARGRLPIPVELDNVGSELVKQFGSIRRAFDVIRKATGAAQWDSFARERTQDLLVYLALSCFTGRRSPSDLPAEIRLDIRALLSSYNNACSQADKLLFSAGRPEEVSRACGSSEIGKCTAEALYLHADVIPAASPLVRVYEGCARAYVGSVDGTNIVKMHRLKPQVSYLSYPDFETDPHPALRESLKVRFRGLQIEYRDYRDSANPFILHRKEAFLGLDHPLRPKFERLTKQEESRGLLGLHANQIGTRNGWLGVLHQSGYALRGHRLIRVCATSSDGDESSRRSQIPSDDPRGEISPH